jgi:putative two-component system response regulator
MRQAAMSDTPEERSRSGSVLIVDDSKINLTMLARMLMRQGHAVRTATNGEDALAIIAQNPPDVILLDVMMPGKDGFDVCQLLKSDSSTRLIPIVLVTALQDSQSKVRGLEAGADDFLTKPVNVPELCARVRSLLKLKWYTDELESADSVLMLLAQTIEARDSYTDGHCHRLARYAVGVGRKLGLSEDDLKTLEYGGFLHDIGKIAIPDALLFKPDALTRSEYEVVKQHTVIGDRLCGQMRSLNRVRSIVRSHHERLDGSGYPDGLRGDAIPCSHKSWGPYP